MVRQPDARQSSRLPGVRRAHVHTRPAASSFPEPALRDVRRGPVSGVASIDRRAVGLGGHVPRAALQPGSVGGSAGRPRSRLRVAYVTGAGRRRRHARVSPGGAGEVGRVGSGAGNGAGRVLAHAGRGHLDPSRIAGDRNLHLRRHRLRLSERSVAAAGAHCGRAAAAHPGGVSHCGPQPASLRGLHDHRVVRPGVPRRLRRYVPCRASALAAVRADAGRDSRAALPGKPGLCRAAPLPRRERATLAGSLHPQPPSLRQGVFRWLVSVGLPRRGGPRGLLPFGAGSACLLLEAGERDRSGV